MLLHLRACVPASGNKEQGCRNAQAELPPPKGKGPLRLNVFLIFAQLITIWVFALGDIWDAGDCAALGLFIFLYPAKACLPPWGEDR